MEILISTIAHDEQPYDTCGNWEWMPDATLTVTISKLPDERYEFLVMLHEFVEAYLCRAAGVSGEAVTRFDVEWLERRKGHQAGSVEALAAISGPEEPGDDPAAPYFKQHRTATLVEQLVAHELGVDWIAYSEAISQLK